MLQYLVKRLLGLIPTLLFVGVLVFMFVHLLPGDPARLAAGPDATPETVALVRQDLGLDKPLPQQFLRFATGALRGDFGKSLRTKRPVATEIGERFMPTFALIPVVTMMGLQFGFLLGGSIVVEVVFNWPGMGRLLIDAVDMRDYPVIQTEILLFSLEFILINLVVDVLYAVINPTIRYR